MNNEIEGSRKQKIKFYENLRSKDGKIQPRWNSTCLDTDKISKIRKKLLEMSDNACAFCGVRIDNKSFDVEHFLPKDGDKKNEGFPYLAYCWENYLPSCETCNQNHKGTFIPQSLKNQAIIEDILQTKFPQAQVYHQQSLLNSTTDRIIEPCFDNPDEHLAFIAEFFSYQPITEIGRLTNQMFFNHKEVAQKWETLSNFIKKLVANYPNAQELVNDYINLHGYEFICKKLLEYWQNEKQAGRINR
ncbi:MAG: hypothetical protein MUE85_19610 [Microscillaceae bacterium]|nr:hypothetical protein [Microscillaceae bacterium]